MWHVSSRSGVATLQTAIHLLLTYLLPTPNVACLLSCRYFNFGAMHVSTLHSTPCDNCTMIMLDKHAHYREEKEVHWLCHITRVETRQRPLSITTLSTNGHQKNKQVETHTKARVGILLGPLGTTCDWSSTPAFSKYGDIMRQPNYITGQISEHKCTNVGQQCQHQLYPADKQHVK